MTNLTKLPSWADDDNILAVVETPRGSSCKLDFDPKLGAEEGLVAIAEAKDIRALAEEHMWAAELNRIEGELRRIQGAAPVEVERLFQNALAIARDQKAKSFELRAAISLARLRRDQGHPTEAKDLLAPIYDWFKEGFDTPDLADAKALLQDL